MFGGGETFGEGCWRTGIRQSGRLVLESTHSCYLERDMHEILIKSCMFVRKSIIRYETCNCILFVLCGVVSSSAC